MAPIRGSPETTFCPLPKTTQPHHDCCKVITVCPLQTVAVVKRRGCCLSSSGGCVSVYVNGYKGPSQSILRPSCESTNVWPFAWRLHTVHPVIMFTGKWSNSMSLDNNWPPLKRHQWLTHWGNITRLQCVVFLFFVLFHIWQSHKWGTVSKRILNPPTSKTTVNFLFYRAPGFFHRALYLFVF